MKPNLLTALVIGELALALVGLAIGNYWLVALALVWAVVLYLKSN